MRIRLGLAVIFSISVVSVASARPPESQEPKPPPKEPSFVNKLKAKLRKAVEKDGDRKSFKKTKNGGSGVRGYATPSGPRREKRTPKEPSTLNKVKNRFRKWVEGDRKKTYKKTKNGGPGVRGYAAEAPPERPDGDFICREAIAGAEVRMGVASVAALDALTALTRAAGIQDAPKIYQGDVSTAIAAILDGRRVIIYSPEFVRMLEQATDREAWVAYSVLAHELGHHVNGHTLGGHGDGWLQELQADYYSGFALARLGASREDARAALLAWSDVTSEVAGTVDHPPLEARLEHVDKGWREGAAQAARPADAKTQRAPSLYDDDLEAAARAAAKNGGETDALTRQGYANLEKAGRLIKKNNPGAARSYLYKAQVAPKLKTVATWWLCRSYALQNNPLEAEDCFSREGIDPAGP